MNQGVLAGILKWSLTQGDGLQANDDVRPMSEEDAEFLLEAFESVTIDEVQRMKVIAQVLSLPEDPTALTALTHQSTAFIRDLQQVGKGVTEGETVAVTPAMAKKKKKRRPWQGPPSEGKTGESEGEEEGPSIDPSTIDVPSLLAEVIARKEGALDELDERVLSLDNAVDLHTVGGFSPLLFCLSSLHPSIRWRAAQALATICQNNPRCQQFTYDLHPLTPLLALLTPPTPPSPPDSPEWLCVVKALYALSSLLRSTTPAASDFLRQGGLEAIVVLLQLHPSAPARVVAKGCGLVRFLIEHEREVGGSGVGEVVTKMGLWEAVKEFIGVEDVNVREEAMRLLERASEEEGMRRAIGREEGLKERVQDRVAAIEKMTGEDKQTCEEEYDLAQRLLQRLSSTAS